MENVFDIKNAIKTSYEALVKKNYSKIYYLFEESINKGKFSPTLLLRNMQAIFLEQTMNDAYKLLDSYQNYLRKEQKQNISELFILFCAEQYLKNQKYQKAIKTINNRNDWMKIERYKKSLQILVKSYLSLGNESQALKIVTNIVFKYNNSIDDIENFIDILIKSIKSVKPKNNTINCIKKVPAIKLNNVIFSHISELQNILPDLKLLSGSTEFSHPIESISFHKNSIEPGTLFIPAIKSVVLKDSIDRSAEEQKKATEEALFAGASAAIVDKYESTNFPNYAPVFYYPDRTKLYKTLANYGRKRLSGHVIAITGSYGKTTTREMISQTLSNFQITSTQYDNRNSISGICETLASTPEYVKNCVLELGVSLPGTMSELVNIAKPDITIILDITDSHLMNYANQKELLIEKFKILKQTNNEYPIIISRNTLDLDIKLNTNIIKKSKFKYLSVGTNDYDDIQLVENYSTSYGSKAKIRVLSEFIDVNLLNFTSHLALTACYVLGVAHVKGLSLKKAARSLTKYKALELQRGTRWRLTNKLNNNISIELIDDAQSSISNTVLSLLNQLSNRNPKRLIFVMGDMYNIGKESSKKHLSLINDIEKAKVNILITIGNETKIIHDILKQKIQSFHFKNIQEAKKTFLSLVKNGDLIALKGSGLMKIGLLRDILSTKYDQEIIRSGWKIELE